jgi:hypothetical protein
VNFRDPHGQNAMEPVDGYCPAEFEDCDYPGGGLGGGGGGGGGVSCGPGIQLLPGAPCYDPNPPPPNPVTTNPGCYDWTCMPAAFSRAVQALTLNSNCMSLFGTATTRANGFNPANVLTDIIYGSHNFGTVSFSSHSTNWGVAQTRPAGLVPIPGLAGKVKISINELSGYGFWNNGDATENAETLLHELGHVFNDLRGAGGFALPNSAENSDPYAFDKLVKQKCFN